MDEPLMKPTASAAMAGMDTGTVAAALASEGGCVESLQPDKRRLAASAAARSCNVFMLTASDADPETLTSTARRSDQRSLTLLRASAPPAATPRGSAG